MQGDVHDVSPRKKCASRNLRIRETTQMRRKTLTSAMEGMRVKLDGDQVEHDEQDYDDTSDAIDPSLVHPIKMAFINVSKTDAVGDKDIENKNEGEDKFVTDYLLKSTELRDKSNSRVAMPYRQATGRDIFDRIKREEEVLP